VAATLSADELRAMAEHRGLKLVRSRKRTPGVGDYGKYGLTDAKGQALFGVGDNGLTAGAKEIEDYLRGGALSSWKLSAETTPDRPPPKARQTRKSEVDEASPVRRRGKVLDKRVAAPRKPAGRSQEPPPPPRSKPELRLVSQPAAPPVPRPVSELKLRASRGDDARALGDLLDQLAGHDGGSADTADRLASMRKAKAGVLVAELETVIGCCAWAMVPTLQHGVVGRVTLLLVDADHRRRGVGTKLLAAAEAALAKAGCRAVEAMSDIMIANSHNFFRARDYEQISYRFVREIGEVPATRKT
jgi:N-acetylglutamate synthase-like GNAT family acetyltransferase